LEGVQNDEDDVEAQNYGNNEQDYISLRIIVSEKNPYSEIIRKSRRGL